MAESFGMVDIYGSDGEIRPLADIKREVIRHAVKHSESPTKAAEQLQIGRTTVYRTVAEDKKAESPDG